MNLQASLSWAIFLQTSHVSHHSISLISTSHPLLFWLTTDLLPLTCLHTTQHLGSRESSICSTWPNHLNLHLMTVTSTLFILPKDQSVVFLSLSQLISTCITWRHSIMKACRQFICVARATQVSLPYSIVGRMTALNKRSLVPSFRLFLHHTTLERLWNVCASLPILLSVSRSNEQSWVMVVARYS